jgi:hypothetical protein
VNRDRVRTSDADRDPDKVPGFHAVMRPLIRISTLLAGIALVLPAASAARGPVRLAPPGDSAVSQYAEVVPNDLGASPPRPGGRGGGVLGSTALHRLTAAGADGQALVGVVDETTPPPLLAAAGGQQGGVGAQRGGRTGGASVRLRGVSAERRRDAAAGNSSSASAGGAGSAGTSTAALKRALSGAQSASPAAQILGSVGGEGLGIVLGVVLLAGGLGLVVRAVRRRRAG